MKSTRERAWKQVWEKKGDPAYKGLSPNTIWDLVVMNGYDSGADGISLSSWTNWVNCLKQEIPNYSEVTSWLDAGCGAGAFLFSQDSTIKLYGFDYSRNLIGRAKEFQRPVGEPAILYVGDLTDEGLYLPKADIISCVSSLQYLPEPAGLSCFSALLDAAKRGVLIAENPCKHSMESGKKFRDANLQYDADEKYAHTYYSVTDFNHIAMKKGFKAIEIKAELGQQSSYRWSMYYEKVLFG